MRSDNSGAAAVEFALIIPVLLILVMGIIEFGFLTFLNSSAAGAAREGARDMAIFQDQVQAKSVATDTFKNTTGGKLPTAVDVPASCSAGSPVVVSVTYTYPALTRFFGTDFEAEGIGEMRCGG